MLGAMIGDTLGSSFDCYPMKTKKFELLDNKSHFTDDTVMTVAVADSLMNEVPYVESLQEWVKKYPRVAMASGSENGYIKMILNLITVSGTALQCDAPA